MDRSIAGIAKRSTITRRNRHTYLDSYMFFFFFLWRRDEEEEEVERDHDQD